MDDNDYTMPPEIPGAPWAEALPRVFLYALRLTGRPDLAEEVVGMACTRVCKGKSPWDPERVPNFTAFMCGVVDSVLSNERQSWHARHMLAWREGVDDYARSPSPGPEYANIRREKKEIYIELLRELRARIPKGDLMGDVLRFIEEGDERSAAEQAAALGVSVRKIEHAREKLRDWLLRIAKERGLI
jgi:DNA-directed RNA polymerase specialized sigma24 family protein